MYPNERANIPSLIHHFPVPLSPISGNINEHFLNGVLLTFQRWRESVRVQTAKVISQNKAAPTTPSRPSFQTINWTTMPRSCSTKYSIICVSQLTVGGLMHASCAPSSRRSCVLFNDVLCDGVFYCHGLLVTSSGVCQEMNVFAQCRKTTVTLPTPKSKTIE